MALNKTLFILVMTYLISNCSLPYADKHFLNFDPAIKADRVKYEVMGPVLILKIKTGESPSVIEALNATAKINSCTDLKNIDIEFFENYYYIIGFPKLLIQADCVKSTEEKK